MEKTIYNITCHFNSVYHIKKGILITLSHALLKRHGRPNILVCFATFNKILHLPLKIYIVNCLQSNTNQKFYSTQSFTNFRIIVERTDVVHQSSLGQQ